MDAGFAYSIVLLMKTLLEALETLDGFFDCWKK
jgi:hypothetical protein